MMISKLFVSNRLDHPVFRISASDPICNSLRTSNSLEDQTMNENDGLSLSCRIQFWGNWPPTMQWSISGDTLKDDETITEYTGQLAEIGSSR